MSPRVDGPRGCRPEEPPPLVDDTGLAAALFPYRLPLWELDHC